MPSSPWSVAAIAALVLSSNAWAQGAPAEAVPRAEPATATERDKAEPPPPAATPAIAPETPLVEPTTQPPPAAAPAVPAATNGLPAYFQPGLLMQGWVVVEKAGSGSDSKATSYARLRRAEIYAKGKIIPDRVSYLVMFDLARVLEPSYATIKVDNQDPPATGSKAESVKVKQSTSAVAALQDYYMQLTTEYADLYFGQFKIPVSFDGSQTPPNELLMPDRSSPTVFFDDRRDVGFKATKKFKYLRYTAGLFNGSGQGVLDNNNAKAVALRLDFFPIDGVGVGAVGYYTVAQVRKKAADDRYEADFHIEKAGFNFQAEYMRWHQANVPTAAKPEQYTEAQGGYAMLAYRVLEDLQPVVRVSYLDPDTKRNLKPKSKLSTELDEYWQYEVGLNYYVKKNEVKLQATVGRFEYENKTPKNQLIVEAQLNY